MSEINVNEELPKGKFPIDLKLIQIYKLKEPSIIARYKNGTYRKGSFHGFINSYLSPITREDNIVIPSKIKS